MPSLNLKIGLNIICSLTVDVVGYTIILTVNVLILVPQTGDSFNIKT